MKISGDYFIYTSALAIFLGISNSVAASDERAPIEEVHVYGSLGNYSALKSAAPIMETARSVSIEKRDQIVDKGALNLADTYTYSAGVTGEAFGFATRGDWLRVRGLDVPQYQDSLQSLFGNYNNTRPDIHTIEQVEILKGPASVLYGQGSPGGIVNVVSKRPQEESAGEFLLSVGNYDYKRIAADVTGRLDKDGEWLYRAVTVYRDTDTQVDVVKDDAVVFAPSITWRPSQDTSISLLVNYQKTDGDTGAQFLPVSGTLTAAPNGQFIDTGVYLGEATFNEYDAETTSATLLAEHTFNEMWSMEFTARTTSAEADYRQAWPAFIGGDRYVYNADGTLYQNGMVPRSFYTSDARSEQTALDVRFRAEWNTGGIEHDILIGGQYQDVVTEDDSAYAYALGFDFATRGPDATLGDTYWINLFSPSYGSVPPQSILDLFFVDSPEATIKDTGIYISDQISLRRWRGTIGLRYDDVENDNGSTVQKDDAFSASAGVLYQATNGLSPYISYAESFQPVVGVDGVSGNSLRPQEGRQYEVGVKYSPSLVDGIVTLAYFDIEQSNLSNPNALVNANSQQEGVAEIQGIELESIIDFENISLEINLSKLSTEDANGFQFASVPEINASSWLRLAPLQQLHGLVAGMGVRYAGKSKGGADTLITPSYTIVDMMLGFDLDKWSLRLNGRNLADKEYQATCLARGDCFPGERRTVVGTVAYSF